MWHCGIHSQRLFTLLFDHQVHVVVLQDGDHLYLHGTLLRMRSTAHIGLKLRTGVLTTYQLQAALFTHTHYESFSGFKAQQSMDTRQENYSLTSSFFNHPSVDVSHWQVVFHHCTDICWEAANSLVIAILHNSTSCQHQAILIDQRKKENKSTTQT